MKRTLFTIVCALLISASARAGYNTPVSGLNPTGSGAAIPTGPTTSVSGDLLSYTNNTGQLGDSGAALSSLFTTSSVIPVTNGGTGLASPVGLLTYNGTSGPPTSNSSLPIALGGSGFYLPHFLPKLQAVVAGTGRAKICPLGDSTTFGTYSNGTATGDFQVQSYPTQLARELTSMYGINAHQDAFMGDQSTAQTVANDSRVVQGSSWTQYTSSTTIGGSFLTASTATNALSFTPSNNIDSFKVWYQQAVGNGSLSINVDGGTATVQNTSGTTALSSVTVTASSGVGSHTVNIYWSSGGAVFVAGVEAFDSTQNQVSVVNTGWSNSTSINWAVNTNAYSPGSPAAYIAFGCDLTIIDLGINDYDTPATGVSAYIANMRTVINAAQASGDVIVTTPVPTSPGGGSGRGATVAVQNQYNAALRTLVKSLNIPLVDNAQRWQSFANANNFGLYGDTFTHPNAAGYADFARSIADVIVPPGTSETALGEGDNTLYRYKAVPSGTGANLAAFSSNSIVQTGIGVGNTTTGHVATLFEGGSNFSGYFGATDTVSGTASELFTATPTAFQLGSNSVYGFNSGVYALSPPDTSWSRISAGVVGFGTGAKGSVAGSIQTAQLIGGGSAPTISAGTGAGTSPTVSVAGTNIAGVISVTTGTSPANTATLATITDNGTMAIAPQGCNLTPRNALTAAAAAMVYVTAPTTTSWSIGVGSAPLTASVPYQWSYSCE